MKYREYNRNERNGDSIIYLSDLNNEDYFLSDVIQQKRVSWILKKVTRLKKCYRLMQE